MKEDENEKSTNSANFSLFVFLVLNESNYYSWIAQRPDKYLLRLNTCLKPFASRNSFAITIWIIIQTASVMQANFFNCQPQNCLDCPPPLPLCWNNIHYSLCQTLKTLFNHGGGPGCDLPANTSQIQQGPS